MILEIVRKEEDTLAQGRIKEGDTNIIVKEMN